MSEVRQPVLVQGESEEVTMSDINFRVRAHPVGKGEEFVRENFRTEQEARGLFDELQSTEEGGIMDSVEYKAVAVVLEELCNGEWTTVCRRMLVR